MLNINQIMEILPHRYPFLLVDRIIDIEKGQRVKGLKNVTINEPFFNGHFPGMPVMPGVLIIEAMAQTGAFLALSGQKELHNKVLLFAAIDHCKFKRPVYPGDQLLMELTVKAKKGKIWKMGGKAFVDGVLAAQADLTAAVTERS